MASPKPLRETDNIGNSHEAQLSGIFRDLISSFYGMVRGEIRLAKTEFIHGVKDVGKKGANSAISVGLLFFGAQSLVAFVVIGLGHLLGDRFWLSAAIVGFLFAGIGGALLRSSLRGIKEDVTLDVSRHSLEDDREFLERKVHDITERMNQTRTT